ncbi:MAG: hypothetical protein JXM70_05160, partial [Pirellulales bacterium]|nr:hypothetical protein [Pirellulales bacterium]
MQKLVSLLVIVVMACPVVAVGATGTYQDSFDNAAPDNYWVFQDEANHTEGWTPGGQAWNATQYTVGFGGTCNVDSATSYPYIPPYSVYGLLSNSSFGQIAYAGSLTVHGLLNGDHSLTSVTDEGLIGFMGEAETSGQPGYGYADGYLMMNSPSWRYCALYAVKNIGSPIAAGNPGSQAIIRLAIDEPYSSQPTTPPLMNDVCDWTMQIEVIDTGHVRISGLGIADHNNDGTDEVSKLQFIVGTDTPPTSGHEPPGTYTAADVPVVLGGYTGFLGNVLADNPG